MEENNYECSLRDEEQKYNDNTGEIQDQDRD